MTKRCQKCSVKPGWECGRVEGHEGPCAAWPTDVYRIPHGEDEDITVEYIAHAKHLLTQHMHIFNDADNKLIEIAMEALDRAKAAYYPIKKAPPFGGLGGKVVRKFLQ